MTSRETIKVKICGVRTPEDALVAAQAGADFVGLSFVPGSRRRVDVSVAKNIVSAVKSTGQQRPKMVGLFADQVLEEVNQTIEACGLDAAQLCGQESLEYCRDVEAQVIKVLHVEPNAGQTATDSLSERVGRYTNVGHLVTLDRFMEGVPGGTGQTFDWDVAAQISSRGFSFLLAGGLDPSNVSRAAAHASPWGVDVSSGVETNGTKDHDKIRAFVSNARAFSSTHQPLH